MPHWIDGPEYATACKDAKAWARGYATREDAIQACTNLDWLEWEIYRLNRWAAYTAVERPAWEAYTAAQRSAREVYEAACIEAARRLLLWQSHAGAGSP